MHPFDLIRCVRCSKPAAEWVTGITHKSCQLCEPCYQARLAEPKRQADPDAGWWKDVADVRDFISEDAPKIITWIKRQRKAK